MPHSKGRKVFAGKHSTIATGPRANLSFEGETCAKSSDVGSPVFSSVFRFTCLADYRLFQSVSYPLADRAGTQGFKMIYCLLS